jgi:hypothetical protein
MDIMLPECLDDFIRRETVKHPFGTMKARMGATHFLCKTLPKSSRRDGSLGPGL